MIRKDDDPLWDETIPEDFAHGATTSLRGAFRDGVKDATERFDLGVDFDVLEPKVVDYGAQRGAELVGKKWVDGVLVDNPDATWAIEQTTRDTVRDLLGEALKDGWSIDDFEARLEESGIFGEARSEMIARTEVAIAEARGHTAAFRAEGVENVYIYDGDSDEECQEANGQIWTIDEYEADPIAHPNCVRDARPLTAREEEQEAA